MSKEYSSESFASKDSKEEKKRKGPPDYMNMYNKTPIISAVEKSLRQGSIRPLKSTFKELRKDNQLNKYLKRRYRFHKGSSGGIIYYIMIKFAAHEDRRLIEIVKFLNNNGATVNERVKIGKHESNLTDISMQTARIEFITFFLEKGVKVINNHSYEDDPMVLMFEEIIHRKEIEINKFIYIVRLLFKNGYKVSRRRDEGEEIDYIDLIVSSLGDNVDKVYPAAEDIDLDEVNRLSDLIIPERQFQRSEINFLNIMFDAFKRLLEIFLRKGAKFKNDSVIDYARSNFLRFREGQRFYKYLVKQYNLQNVIRRIPIKRPSPAVIPGTPPGTPKGSKGKKRRRSPLVIPETPSPKVTKRRKVSGGPSRLRRTPPLGRRPRTRSVGRLERALTTTLGDIGVAEQISKFLAYGRKKRTARPVAVKIRKSKLKNKKYTAIFELSNGKKKSVSFGGIKPNGVPYSDFIKHKDPKRKMRYINRHRKNENWKDPTARGTLSRFILWNKTTLKASIRDYKKRFKLK